MRTSTARISGPPGRGVGGRAVCSRGLAIWLPRALWLPGAIWLLGAICLLGAAWSGGAAAAEPAPVPVPAAAPGTAPAAASDAPPADLTVLPASIDGVAPADLLRQHLLDAVEAARARWVSAYEERTTPDQIAAYQKGLREAFVEALGGFPSRTPLDATTTGAIERDGYRVEKVIFESQPGVFVTAALFLPDPARHRPAHPGVLVPCGHSANGKAYDSYQTMGAALAFHGMAALVFDPIEQGERFQLLDAEGKPVIGGTTAHTMVGVGSILVGRNVATFEVWDGMRALDYLVSRPEVDPKRIGCTGNSGGGTQTSYLMALDDRIGAAAPSCYLTTLPALLRTIGPQDAEQNIFGQLAFGMDHADYVMMRAPTPILICAATKDFFDIGGTWESFRFAKRLYTRLGHPERVELLENDAPHNYNKLQRQGVLRWMARWLLRTDGPLVEPPIRLLTEEEIRATPRGQVMLLPGARTVYDLNLDRARELAEERAARWQGAWPPERLERVRALSGIRRLEDLPAATLDAAALDAAALDEGPGGTAADGVLRRDGVRIRKLVLRPEGGVLLPALLLGPDRPSDASPDEAPILQVHEAGKAADLPALEELARSGRMVLAVDVRGTGETAQTQRPWAGEFGQNLREVFLAYLLGRSFVGMRAEDILVGARTCAAELAGGRGIELRATGNVCVPALHAAALEPGLFSSVKLTRPLASWWSVLECRRTRDQLVNAVHGALAVYDLPELAASLGGKLSVADPVDARGDVLSASPPAAR